MHTDFPGSRDLAGGLPEILPSMNPLDSARIVAQLLELGYPVLEFSQYERVPVTPDWGVPRRVERRARLLRAATGAEDGEGLAALCESAAHPAASMDDACDTVIRGLARATAPGGRKDDVALLMARLNGIAPGDVAVWRLPSGPRQVRRARLLTGDQLAAWESFWKDAPTEAGAVFWDAAPELSAALHLPLFEGHFGGRPVVDLGCGNGTQTHFLAARYAPVVGVDISRTAVARARQTAGSTAEFRMLDATDAAAVYALGEELGGSDVYLRGVLHQCEPETRSRLATAVASLVGERGRAFVVEPAEAGGAALAALLTRPEGPPPALAAVLAHGIRPMEMPDASVPVLFEEAGLAVLDQGSVPLTLTVRGPDGRPAQLPSNWLVAGHTV